MTVLVFVVAFPWLFAGGLGLWLIRRWREKRRERAGRELMRRRVNREINHPGTWNGDSAA